MSAFLLGVRTTYHLAWAIAGVIRPALPRTCRLFMRRHRISNVLHAYCRAHLAHMNRTARDVGRGMTMQ